MTATEYLSLEHRVIEQMLGVLEKLAAAARAGTPDAATAAEVLSFVSEYADALHHRKEEDLLFKRMSERGFPADGGPIAVMLAEHDQGRGLVARLKASGGAGARFADDAESYAFLLRAHIGKEDLILYRFADRVLTPEDQNELVAEFEAIDARENASRWIARAEELGSRFGVARRSLAAALAQAPACGM